MIVVNVSKTGITVDGHAEYAETGKDIICAAVSVLAQNLVLSMEFLTEDKIEYQIRDGHMDIIYKNLSEKGKLLVDSFFIGVSEITRAYGEKYVKINAAADGR